MGKIMISYSTKFYFIPRNGGRESPAEKSILIRVDSFLGLPKM